MSTETMQGLTPTITITVPESIDLTEALHCYLSIKQGKKLLTLTESDGVEVYAHRAEAYLTQEQTLSFNEGALSVQLNWTYSSGQRAATRPAIIKIGANHILEVLE